MSQFENLRASSLYCAQCGEAQPVVEILGKPAAHKQIFDYLCARCGHLVGNREILLPSQGPEFTTPPPEALPRVKIL